MLIFISAVAWASPDMLKLVVLVALNMQINNAILTAMQEPKL